MPKRQRRREDRGHGLRRAIGAALALKLLALTVIYFAFFAPPAERQPDAPAAAVLGLAK